MYRQHYVLLYGLPCPYQMQQRPGHQRTQPTRFTWAGESVRAFFFVFLRPSPPQAVVDLLDARLRVLGHGGAWAPAPAHATSKRSVLEIQNLFPSSKLVLEISRTNLEQRNLGKPKFQATRETRGHLPREISSPGSRIGWSAAPNAGGGTSFWCHRRRCRSHQDYRPL